MATRYWVGGSGNWTDTAKWSTTSGGAGGASVPTLDDDVIINSSSGGGTVTMALNQSCKSFTTTGATVTVVGDLGSIGSTRTLSVYGNVTLSTTTTMGSTAAFVRVDVLATANINIPNAVIEGGVRLNAPGGTFTLTSALGIRSNFNVSEGRNYRSLSLIAGTLVTNNNNIVANAFISNSTNTRAITLGSSTITLIDDFDCGTGENLTVSAGTSSITCEDNFNGGNAAYYNITLKNANPGGISNPETRSTFGSFGGVTTCRSLTIQNTNYALFYVDLLNSFTATTSFIASTGTSARRIRVFSDVEGTSRTITAASVTLGYVDFRDITGAGTASWSGTSVGNVNNNSGIIFTAATTRYARTPQNSTASKFMFAGWSTTSGGSTGAIYPLPQDTVYIDANSGTGQINLNDLICTTLICTGYTGTIYSGESGDYRNILVYGNATLPATTNPSLNINLLGNGTHTVTVSTSGTANDIQFGTTAYNSGSYTVNGNLTTDNIQKYRCGLTLNGSVTVGTFTDNGGVFSAGSNNITATNLTFSSSYSGVTSTVNLGSGTITISNSFSMSTSSDLTLQAHTGTITFTGTDTTCSFSGGNRTYNNLVFNKSVNATITISGSNTFNSISSTANASTYVFSAGATNTFTTFLISGASTSSRAIIKSDSTSVKTTLAKPTVWKIGSGSIASNTSGVLFTDGDGMNFLNLQYIEVSPRAGSNFMVMF